MRIRPISLKTRQILAVIGIALILCGLSLKIGRRYAVLTKLFGAKQPCLILMYHNLTTDEAECGSVTVTQDRFRADIEWLKENGYSFILPQDLAEKKPLPDKPVMITFDDGYLSNYTLAYPVLLETGAKANINVIASIIDDGGYAVFCGWDQLAEMAASGAVEIGSHTYDLHNPATGGEVVPGGPNGVQKEESETVPAFEERLSADLSKSVELIEANVGKPVYCLAYPFGENDKPSRAVAEAMFPVTLCTYAGMADVYKYYGHNLPRNNVTMDTDLAELARLGHGWLR